MRQFEEQKKTQDSLKNYDIEKQKELMKQFEKQKKEKEPLLDYDVDKQKEIMQQYEKMKQIQDSNNELKQIDIQKQIKIMAQIQADKKEQKANQRLDYFKHLKRQQEFDNINVNQIAKYHKISCFKIRNYYKSLFDTSLPFENQTLKQTTLYMDDYITLIDQPRSIVLINFTLSKTWNDFYLPQTKVTKFIFTGCQDCYFRRTGGGQMQNYLQIKPEYPITVNYNPFRGYFDFKHGDEEEKRIQTDVFELRIYLASQDIMEIKQDTNNQNVALHFIEATGIQQIIGLNMVQEIIECLFDHYFI